MITFFLHYIGCLFQAVMIVILSYNKNLQESSYYYLLALLVSIVGNLSWYSLTKKVSIHNTYVYGSIWDVTLGATFLFLPLLLYKTNVSLWGYLGAALMVIGSIIIGWKG